LEKIERRKVRNSWFDCELIPFSNQWHLNTAAETPCGRLLYICTTAGSAKEARKSVAFNQVRFAFFSFFFFFSIQLLSQHHLFVLFQNWPRASVDDITPEGERQNN
jgi:hypothetical protein